MKNTLLVIDPQNDFLDAPGAALPVAGASADMQRLTEWFRAGAERFDDVVLTLDSHAFLDIGHPAFWRYRDARPVLPFTTVTPEAVSSGELAPVEGDQTARVIRYLERLAVRGRYQHMIWPAHCLVGTTGHAVEAGLNRAVMDWEAEHGRDADRVMKGLNRYCESYSAIAAEVPDPSDMATHTNWDLLNRLLKADRIFVAGEALSHCVRSTVIDLIYLSDRPPAEVAGKLVLLRDATSPVPGFEDKGEEFIEMCRGLGASIINIQ